ncbi:MAG TPA: DUF1127 domain-containing protein [Candidatus Competibacter sp.]|nr:DUF1127 domain-containing protein [Candidatus Competibacteraceae bacterium]HAO31621.1 hypothetical protein [Candidatus Competibacteraceae bacterium]HRE55648.1 DUF1127 domain-containing protein [Candidatus Competibacter sp.]HUM93010.1 DUF1127 domain-containing protein [Candidatus Competibacter sp.]
MYREASSCWEFPSNRAVSVSAHVRGAWVRVCGWYETRRQRRALLALDDAMLKDIGISRIDALQEGHKPFWRP